MSKVSIRETYGQALVQLGRSNNDVVVLDADVSHSTRSVLFGNEFPDRFFNIGIAESNMMSIAAGLAACGKIPFANTFSFLATLRAGDAVSSLIAYNALNVKIAGAYSGLSDSNDGASHQSVCDIAVMRSLPNMTVVVVADAVETKMAVESVAKYNGPVFLRLSRAELPVIFDDSHIFDIGKGNIVCKGSDVTIIATGYMVHKAVEAAKLLLNKGVNAEIIEIHTIKPIDTDIIVQSVKRTRAVVTAEEHSIIGGLGSVVAEVLCHNIPTPMEFIGINDTFAESGEYEELLSKYGLDAQSIVYACLKVITRKES